MTDKTTEFVKWKYCQYFQLVAEKDKNINVKM